jgi:predicted DNA-binding protein with PD1-like motif
MLLPEMNFLWKLSAAQATSLLHGEKTHVKAQIILADQLGKTSGGRLFSDTLLFGGELQLIELLGPPASREYDQDSGRMLWAVNKLKK